MQDKSLVRVAGLLANVEPDVLCVKGTPCVEGVVNTSWEGIHDPGMYVDMGFLPQLVDLCNMIH
eukprot:scaffold1629_cov369-Prasinococcus_capsulatus_cf.AAC.27